MNVIDYFRTKSFEEKITIVVIIYVMIFITFMELMQDTEALLTQKFMLIWQLEHMMKTN